MAGMRGADFLPLGIVGAIAAFVVYQAMNVQRTPAPTPAPPAESPVPAPATPQGTTAAESVIATAPLVATSTAGPDSGITRTVASSEPPPARDLELVRSLIRDGSPGTYLPTILEQQDQFIVRWPVRGMDAIRVWIDRRPGLPDWDPNYAIVAERVFGEWQRAGFPLRFDVVLDSANTEIQIRWIASFPDEEREKLGMAAKMRDQHGWIRAATITIATHHRDGRRLPAELVAGTARHEVGHALGLGHSPGAGDVMFPESRTTVISTADRATLRLLYLLPPGSLK